MKNLLSVLFISFLFISCGGSSSAEDSGSNEVNLAPGSVTSASDNQSDPLKNKGIGPISSIEMGELDMELAESGRKLYNSMCSACHQVEQDYIGPSPKGLFERRSPEWIMNMILNPGEMLQDDPIAKKLLEEANGVPMANQGLTQEEARSILEYFRTL